jgi:hypothetical protein
MMGTTLRPMSEFEPTKPAVLHDQLNDKMVAWTGEDVASWRAYSNPHRAGVVEWDGLLFDGWVEAPGG